MNDDFVKLLKYYDKSEENRDHLRDNKLAREFGILDIHRYIF